MTLVSTAAKGAGAGSGAMAQLFDSILGAPAATIDANGLPATYNHLLIVLRVRSTEVTTRNSQLLTFNNDTGANYAGEAVRGLAAAGAGSLSLTANSVGFDAPCASATANFLGATTFLIPSYADTTLPKCLLSIEGSIASPSSGTNNWAAARQSIWSGTAAISRVTVTASGAGNFVAGSRMTIYGIL
jgi:hypothetical protein